MAESDDTAKSSDAARLEVGASGVKANISMGLMDRIAPARAAKSLITARMGQQISEKVCKGEPLNEMEAFFFTTFFEKEMKRYKRQIETKKVMEQIAQNQSDNLPLPSKEIRALAPSEDAFADRFWEDVERVTDDNVRELYARVGLWESRRPGSFSLRTLSVLRDLDRGTKAVFEVLCRKFVLQNYCVLRYELTDSIYSDGGLGWDDFLALADAGLIALEARTYREYPFEGEDAFEVDFGTFSLRLSPHGAMAKPIIRMPIHPLSRAGTELAQLVTGREVCKKYVWAVSCFLQGRKLDGLPWDHGPQPLDVEWCLSDCESSFESVDTLRPELPNRTEL